MWQSLVMISRATSEIRRRKKEINHNGKTEWLLASIAGWQLSILDSSGYSARPSPQRLMRRACSCGAAGDVPAVAARWTAMHMTDRNRQTDRQTDADDHNTFFAAKQ